MVNHWGEPMQGPSAAQNAPRSLNFGLPAHFSVVWCNAPRGEPGEAVPAESVIRAGLGGEERLDQRAYPSLYDV